MQCPFCGSHNHKVGVSAHPSKDDIYAYTRNRHCLDCEESWKTKERVSDAVIDKADRMINSKEAE